MMTSDGTRSRWHGLRREVLRSQAQALGLPLLTANADWSTYEAEFARLLRSASRQLQATRVIFGDIFPDAHRRWAESVCAHCALEAVEPLWAEDTKSLVHEFLDQQGEARIVTVRDQVLGQNWLGRQIDQTAIEELSALGIDPCGERGEYHSLVTYFPGFRRKLQVKALGIAHHGGCSLLDLEVA